MWAFFQPNEIFLNLNQKYNFRFPRKVTEINELTELPIANSLTSLWKFITGWNCYWVVLDYWHKKYNPETMSRSGTDRKMELRWLFMCFDDLWELRLHLFWRPWSELRFFFFFQTCSHWKSYFVSAVCQAAWPATFSSDYSSRVTFQLLNEAQCLNLEMSPR